MGAQRAAISGLVAAVASLSAPTARAQQADNPIKSVMKLMGFATDVGQPADFVVQSRPTKEMDYIPIFQPPPEPARPVIKDKDLTALKGDLDSVEKRADSLRGAFPPAAKAVADEKAQQARPAKNSPAPTSQ